MSLTEAWLKANNNKEREKVEEVADRDGMSVRVSPKGKIVFQYRYRYNGKACRLDLGSYPLISLKQARTELLRYKAALEQGHDPRHVKQLELSSIQSSKTVQELFMLWYDDYCSKRKSSHQKIRRSFEIYVFPEVGNRLVENLGFNQWMELLEKITEKSPSIAARILLNSKHMLKWALKRDFIKANALVDISAGHDLNITKKVRERALSDEDIILSWTALKACRMSPKNKIFLTLLLFFGCRVGELRLAKKEHFDFDKMIWTVPPENHKMGRKTNKPLLRPILQEITPLLDDAFSLSKSDYVFANQKNELEAMGETAHLSMPNNIFQWLKRHKNYDMQKWSVHDLRRTMRTNLSILTEPHVAEIMLGHALPIVWRTYDKHDYLEDQKKAYRAWYQKLQTMQLFDH